MGGFQNYYDYEWVLAEGTLVPFLEAQRVALEGKRVLDIGCGAGAFLNSLAAHFHVEGVGLDYDEEMLSLCKPAHGVALHAADFLTWDCHKPFDFILLRDVLEHCDSTPEMLGRAAALLSEGGLLYVTYSPYFSPFGGHQHNGSGFFSRVPYLQVLPESIFLRLIRVRGNFYKGQRYLREDLRRIRKAHLTTGTVKACCRRLGLAVRHRRIFVIRPDYRYMFGLPTLRMPSFFPLTSLLDPFCTSVELLLTKESGSRDA